MKQYLTEVKKLQKIAGLLTENDVEETYLPKLTYSEPGEQYLEKILKIGSFVDTLLRGGNVRSSEDLVSRVQKALDKRPSDLPKAQLKDHPDVIAYLTKKWQNSRKNQPSRSTDMGIQNPENRKKITLTKRSD